VGRPVTHRRGRGWRGGFLGSALEQYLKLDLTKWLKVLRHLELLPRPLGQDWSAVWLQRFSGTITIWPKSITSDFYHILSDPTVKRLARMIHSGQQATFPKLNFISNRMKIEKVIDEARRASRQHPGAPTPGLTEKEGRDTFGEEDIHDLLSNSHDEHDGEISETGSYPPRGSYTNPSSLPTSPESRRSGGAARHQRVDSSSLSQKFSGWFGSLSNSPRKGQNSSSPEGKRPSLQQMRRVNTGPARRRRGSVIDELHRQTQVFYDDYIETSADEAHYDDKKHGNDDAVSVEEDGTDEEADRLGRGKKRPSIMRIRDSEDESDGDES